MGIYNFLKSLKIFNKNRLRKAADTATIKVYHPTTEDLKSQHTEQFIMNKKLRESSIPDSAGLYPHEVLMLSYAEKYVVGECKFQQFWKYKYAIDDPEQVLSSLVSRGFLCISPVKAKLEYLNISQLKEILRKTGLKVSGDKSELIRRISDNITEYDLMGYIKQRYYTVTEKGKKEIENNEYVLYMHNYPYTNITIWSINRLMQGYPPKLYRDKIWAELNRIDFEQSNILSNTLKFQKVDFLFEENRLSDALPILVLILYNSLNYIIPKQYIDSFNLYVSFKKEYLNLKPSQLRQMINAECGDVFCDIYKCYNALSQNEIEFPDFISGVWVRLGFEDALFSKSEFIDLAVAKISGQEGVFNIICNQKEKILEQGGYHVEA